MDTSQGVSRSRAAAMQAMTSDEVHAIGEAKDVVGRICTRAAGSLRSSLCDSGCNCPISPPAIAL